MFIDEAKLAAQLTHNNIIHIYDLGKVDAYHYIAMEYVEGKDLRSILKTATEKGYPLPAELALFIASKVANALDYAHRRLGLDGKELNLVHRDVSPQNVLISFEGDIKLCDFGIAKAATKVQQTQAGALKGKLQYMSPEQAWGKKIDRRTDIFSLGIVLFEMLTGERLFSGDTDLTILEQVRDARSEAPSVKNPDVPKKVDQIVLKALAKNPQDRYQNASEMEKDINSVLYSFQPAPGPADLAIYMHRLLEASPRRPTSRSTPRSPRPPRPPPPRRRRRGRASSSPRRRRRPSRARPGPGADRGLAPAISVGEEPAKSRTGLFAGIGVGGVVLVAAGYFMTRGKVPSPAAGPPRPPPPPPRGRASATTEAPAAAREGHRPEGRRGRAEEGDRRGGEEAPRGGAEGRRRPGKPAPGAAPAAAPAVSLAPSQPLQPPKPRRSRLGLRSRRRHPSRRPSRPKPTEPVRSPRPRPRGPCPPPARPPRRRRPEGDLVGPGRGGRRAASRQARPVPGLPPQARQIQRRATRRASAPSMIMALVDEKGRWPTSASCEARATSSSTTRRQGAEERPDRARHEERRQGEDVEDLRHHGKAVSGRAAEPRSRDVTPEAP